MSGTIRRSPAPPFTDSYPRADACRDRTGISDLADALAIYQMAEAHAILMPAAYRFMTRWREMCPAGAPLPARAVAAQSSAEAGAACSAYPLDF